MNEELIEVQEEPRESGIEVVNELIGSDIQIDPTLTIEGAAADAKAAGDAIANVESDVSDLSRQLNDETTGLDTKAPVILETVSGAIASFSDGADSMPIRKLVASIEPVQDLHGQDAPYPAGGGKNKIVPQDRTGTLRGVNMVCSNANETISLSGTATDSGGRTTRMSEIVTLQAGTYTFSATTVSGTKQAQYIINNAATDALISDATFTLAEETSVYLGANVASGATYNETVHIQLESGSTATAYAPYSNECPISGWTGAEISNAAVNIWDEEWVNGYYDTSGNFASSNNYVCSKNKIMVEPDTLYYLHFPVAMTIRAYDSNQQFIGTAPGTWRNETFKPAGYFSGVRYITFNSAASGALTTYNNDISINYPATDTAYEPYTGNQISVTFPSEAGTVYGGEDEVISGKLKSTMGIVDLGTLAWVKPEHNNCFLADFNGNAERSGDIYGYKYVSSIFKYGESANNIWAGTADGLAVEPTAISSTPRIFARITSYMSQTADEFKAAMSGVQLCYELAEPVEYDITPQVMTTLYGTNNVWADTGDVEVIYPADTKLYIDNKITQAIANALNS